ncbi:MAG: SsrA-binding protein SmpB [Anaerolineae bacterium]
MSEGFQVIAVNRRARHEYDVKETLEAGLVLTGSEIKSVRAGKVNLAEAYVQVKEGEAWLLDMHVSTYTHGGYANHDPRRPRKLLLHRDEILRLSGQVAQKGYTIVPLRLYLKQGKAKVEIALAKGRKLHDKRQAIAERDAEREVERALKGSWQERD